MIYVTGDTHGDITRFKSPEMKKVGRGDTLIIAGDFGFLWDNSKQEAAALKKLADKNFTIAFLISLPLEFHIIYADIPISAYRTAQTTGKSHAGGISGGRIYSE